MKLAIPFALFSLVTACAVEEEEVLSETEAHEIVGPVPGIPPVMRTTKSIVDEAIGPLTDASGNRRYVGVSVSVIRNGTKSTWHYGERALGSGQAPNSSTLYPLASLTKTFTGTLLTLAERRGTIGGFNDLLDDHTSYPLGGDRDQIMLSDLALHHSGLPHDPPSGIDYRIGSYAGDHSRLMGSLDECSGGDCGPRIPYNQESEYSNYGFSVLGYVLAQKMGGAIQTVFRNNFLTPLGMTRSGYKWEFVEDACVVGGATTCGYAEYGDCDYKAACNYTFNSNAAVTYARSGTTFTRSNHEGSDSTVKMASGTMWSTPRDMLEWLALHTGSSTVATDELKRLRSGTQLVRTQGGLSFFGIERQTASGKVFMRKTGWLPGQVSTFIGVLEDGQTGVVVMANDDSFGVTAAGTAILDAL